MQGFGKIIGIGLVVVWAVVLLGAGVLVVLCYPFAWRRGGEWRRMCRWEEDE